MKLAAVIHDPAVRLIGDQIDRPVRDLEDVGESLQLVGREDPAARVVRRVDDDRARLRRDVPLDGVDRKLELRRREIDAYRLCAARKDHRDVEEPRRREVDHLVAGIEHRAQRRSERPEGAGRHRHVLGVEVDPHPAAQRLDRDLDRPRVAELVGEPVLVLGHGPLRQGLLDLGQRHLLRIAEPEVARLGQHHAPRVCLIADLRQHRLEVLDHRPDRRRKSAHTNSPSRPASVNPAVLDETVTYGSWP